MSTDELRTRQTELSIEAGTWKMILLTNPEPQTDTQKTLCALAQEKFDKATKALNDLNDSVLRQVAEIIGQGN